ncbi:MAG: hypothetical protein LC791_02465 [Acidobacteria bacterium]|nr:hypothetical protein [Acidobacteriota bacterium]
MRTAADRRPTHPLRLHGVALLSAALVASDLSSPTAAREGPEVRGVSRNVLLSAIDAGIRDEIQPYRLKPVQKSGRIDGAVYTPYVRVARFARSAHLRGRRVTPEDIPAVVKEPVLHVAMHWPAGHPGPPPENLSDIVIALIDRPPSVPRVEQTMSFHPRWLVRALRMEDVDGASRTLAELPFDRAVLVGAFPAEFADRAVLEFTAYRTYWTETSGNSREMIVGFVRGPLK